ncbi:hypothetical protein FT643_09205 [Ketobacter sp. MCCC 1A13808]|uniref:hypothetical protein n=1 Tax=Ketobacter sp. MCCC 1A13808 TaxID=2602738 RepID=UPI0012EBFC95|nr:hypothetical protein [Ketobacter sp. MCCC 1A13808]MVF12323.1 hypothetical protein [Ketobacter sp. MCCC 1A13808]
MLAYDIRATGGWTDASPQTGESSTTQKSVFLMASLLGETTTPLSVFLQHTGYGIPTSSIEHPFIVSPESPAEGASISLDAEYVTDRIKELFGLSISRQAQLLGVSRTAVYNWRNGEKLTEKNLARLADLNDTADLFENENVEVTGLLMKRPFTQGKSLLDLLAGGELIYEPSKKLIAQIKQEAEERTSLASRLRSRKLPRIDTNIDLE